MKQNMRLLEGKNALITGANRGIGKAIAIRFAEQGANVAFTDIEYNDQSRDLEKQLAGLGVRGKGYASDASSGSDCETLITKVLEDFQSVQVLVNNAGITRDNLLMRMSEADWDAVISVNLKSVFNMTKAIQRHLLSQRQGSIINMSSVVGLAGNAGQSNYAASKAGILGFTKSVAMELGSRNIRVNAIAPGFIETEMTAKIPEEYRKAWIGQIPLKRPGLPSDVADISLFLASDLSSYVTGQVISVCGGMHM